MSQRESGAPGSKGSVVVVDDDADIRALAEHALTRVGLHVRLAANGLAGLAACRESMPNVVVLDLMMPSMDGEQFIRWMRAEFGDRQPKVVLLSASVIRTEIAERYGVAASLEKPFDLDELCELVLGLCEER